MNTKAELDQKLDNTTPKPTKPPEGPGQPHPKQKEALELYAKVMGNRRMGITVNIGNIAGQLKSLNTNPVFPESLFAQHFMPLFAGEVEETQYVSYAVWIEKISGGDTVAVDIVDEAGKVLFTVPPMLDMSVVEQTKGGAQTMTLIERQYSRMKEYDAAGSQVFLSKKLESMHIRDKPTAQVFNNIKTWNAIFERYGRKDKIIQLGNILDHDPNKEAVNLGAGSGVPENKSDIGDFELDTD